MKIKHVAIHNFRSISALDMDCQSLVVLLGPNNHGKSNVVGAIEFALSTSSKPTRDDFFALRPSGDDELWVELEFEELTKQEQTTFRKYVNAAGMLKIRKTATLKEDGSVDVGYRGYISEPSQWWLRSESIEKLTSREAVESALKDVPSLAKLLEGKGKISKKQVEDFQSVYIEAHRSELVFSEALEESPLLGTKNVAGGILPDFYLIPAVRDLSEETKVKGTTTFGRLLQRTVQEMASREPQFIEIRNKLESLINSLNSDAKESSGRPAQLSEMETTIADELKSWGVKVDIKVTPPELEKIFELGTELHLDDGLKTLAEKKGHGLQRAVIFALVRAWAKALRKNPTDGSDLSSRKASESVIFAIEEPELFLHPHAQRRLASAIYDIAATPEHQVFLCTHSTHFVDLDRYKSIVIVYKETPEKGTTVRLCMSDLFEGGTSSDRKHRFHMASWVNPDRGEMFFAKKVVLVEGPTEAAVFPFLAEKLGCLDSEVSMIDCGSKHNLPLYVTLLNAFRLPYLVVHDEDPLPDPIPADWDHDKRMSKRRTFELNQEIKTMIQEPLGHIEMFMPNFETVAGITKKQGEKVGKVLAALEHFQALEVVQIPTRVQEAVRAAYGKVA